ncbi:hypothetical protein BO86DRAFT_428764 [Aspergillus japonicus CBS 114.51]|uniref:Uncharacterized protein n=1 Tax=Aspergillus japonicus CBS 114.51 TaxID=1448312 RepID=A0A8T8XF66_ASPJA|nr:hypothetical protein BO86DRAFT_428764 [Aspergillus japonicus CBS 114.51]RAH86926.1 hypothetical protein BO86DRAFT_428764 [Aspergillus japonicus CBS 114.51]
MRLTSPKNQIYINPLPTLPFQSPASQTHQLTTQQTPTFLSLKPTNNPQPTKMQLLAYLPLVLGLSTPALSAWGLKAWHSDNCSGSLLTHIENSPKTGCFNFDKKEGSGIRSINGNFNTKDYHITIYPKADCKGTAAWSGKQITPHKCEVFKEWSSKVVMYSYKVTAA